MEFQSSPTARKQTIILGAVIFSLLLVSISSAFFLWQKLKSNFIPPKPGVVSQAKLPTFKTCSEIAQALKEGAQNQNRVYDGMLFNIIPTMQKATQETGSAQPDFSTTNIQVAGVDEADIVKSDGTYFYIVHGNEIVITKAYPPKDAQVFSRIIIAGGEPKEIFLNEDTLVVIGYKTDNIYSENQSSSKEIYPYNETLTYINLYDVSNKEKPELKREVEYEGNYLNSRMIGNYAYLVLNVTRYDSQQYAEESLIPQYRDSQAMDGDFKPICDCTEIKKFDPVQSSNFINIVAVPLNSWSRKIETETVIGGGENIYSSLDNLYITTTGYEPEMVIQNLPQGIKSVMNYFRSAADTTRIYKFNLEKGKINYQGQTQVEGTVLNQFSMDEYDDNFRIATTQGQVARLGGTASNNLYVLDEDLELVGSIENIAPGEKIYSARFMGKKGYIVTFKKVDPLFTLDLSDPREPKIVGQLKIPGYSDYLHPIDENHIIGLGKNTVEAQEGGFAWYQGLKIAIFDVSDFEHPKEIFKTEIGNRGTDSYALNDHKAFLFDKEKELLVIPVLLAELTPEQIEQNTDNNSYGQYTFQGAYVYHISVDDGFKLLGRITHYDRFNENSGYYYYGDDLSIQRSLYIGNYLYTLSGQQLKINQLDDLEEIGTITL